MNKIKYNQIKQNVGTKAGRNAFCPFNINTKKP